MKTIFAALIVLSVTSVSVAAQNAERATFQPLSIPSSADAPLNVAEIAETVRAEGHVVPANLSEVDRNGDGEISFSELLVQDIVSDF